MNSISKLAMPLKRTAAGKRLSPMILLTGIVATMLSTASMAQPQQQLIHVQGTGAMSVTPNGFTQYHGSAWYFGWPRTAIDGIGCRCHAGPC